VKELAESLGVVLSDHRIGRVESINLEPLIANDEKDTTTLSVLGIGTPSCPRLDAGDRRERNPPRRKEVPHDHLVRIDPYATLKDTDTQARKGEGTRKPAQIASDVVTPDEVY
jgi:hypothetical protein